MKNYNVFVSDEAPSEAIKVGWSWPGFFFTWIWALVKGLYPIAIGILVAYVLAGVYGSGSAGGLTGIIPLGVGIWLGLKGNKQPEEELLKKGFAHAAEVTASTPDKALVAFLDQERLS